MPERPRTERDDRGVAAGTQLNTFRPFHNFGLPVLNSHFLSTDKKILGVNLEFTSKLGARLLVCPARTRRPRPQGDSMFREFCYAEKGFDVIRRYYKVLRGHLLFIEYGCFLWRPKSLRPLSGTPGAVTVSYESLISDCYLTRVTSRVGERLTI